MSAQPRPVQAQYGDTTRVPDAHGMLTFGGFAIGVAAGWLFFASAPVDVAWKGIALSGVGGLLGGASAGRSIARTVRPIWVDATPP